MRGILLLAGLALACAGCAGPYGTGYYGSYGYSSPGYGYGYSSPAYYGSAAPAWDYGPGWGYGGSAPLFGGLVIGGGDHRYDHYGHADHAVHFARADHGGAHFTPHAAPHFAAHAAPHFAAHAAPRFAARSHYRLGSAPGTGLNAGKNYGGPG